MQILILGNMANDGYTLCKQLVKMNVDVTLGANGIDFGMSYPEWEDAIIDKPINPYDVKRNELKDSWEPPTWIKGFDFPLNLQFRGIPTRLRQLQKLKKFISEFDIVEAHVPYSIACYFSKTPYIVCDEGWIRTLVKEKPNRSFRGKLIDRVSRSSYSKSKHIIITNPDTRKLFDVDWVKDKKKSFIPFSIDSEKYKPLSPEQIKIPFEKKKDEILLLSPARQDWDVKGNDKILRAFARFAKVIPNTRLILPEWGYDCMVSVELIDTLGIKEKVVWITPVPKHQLIQYYNLADIVLDQFLLGSWGTTTPEAMSCGKPVLLYYEESHIDWAFGEQPPIYKAFTVDEIFEGLYKLAKDTDYREELGLKGREWIKRTHDPKDVAQRHINIWKSTLN